MHQFVTSVILLVALTYQVLCLEFKNEQAKVEYFNPKYVRNLTIFTFRKDRHSPYLTSGYGTNLVPFGNNFIYRLEFTSTKLTAISFKFDFICDDLITKPWSVAFMKKYTNVPLDKCPIPAGIYVYKDMQFPPKNMPVQLADVDYIFKSYIFFRETKERVVEISAKMKPHNVKG